MDERCFEGGFLPSKVHSSPDLAKCIELRGRYGSAGNKGDRFDAFALAGTLRTDRARLRPLVPKVLRP